MERDVCKLGLNGKEIIIADKEFDFADKIICLLKNKNQRQKIYSNAWELASIQYDWKVIDEKMTSLLNKEL